MMNMPDPSPQRNAVISKCGWLGMDELDTLARFVYL